MNKILIIDGNSILNRGFYAIPTLTNSEGEYTNGVYGFLSIMFKFIEEVNPTHIAVAFDMAKPTFRHEMFEDYKGTRKSPPKELIPQFKLIRDVLTKMDIKTFELAGYEADDILGTISKDLEGENDVVVLSGDKDTLQLASNKTTIMIPKTSKKGTTTEVYDFDKVVELYGVTPSEFIDVKALMGDSSDNIPGVTGIGEKGALKIIAEYKSIENAIENSEDITPKRARENLILEKDKAILSKTLATINREVPLKYAIEELLIKDFYNENAILEFKRLGFKSFLSKAPIVEKDLEFKEISIEDLKNVGDLDEIYIYNFIDKESGKNYISLYFNGCVNLVYSENFIDAVKALGNILENEKILKVFFDYKEFYTLMLNNDMGINIKNYFDNSIALYVVNPILKNYSIEETAWVLLDKKLTTDEELLGKGRKKKTYDEVETSDLDKFFASRGDANFRAYNVLLKELKEKDLEDLYYNVELPLATVLGKMENYGVKVDVEQIENFGKDLEVEIDNLTQIIHELAGEEFNINSPSQLGVILFEKLGLKGSKKTKTGYSTSITVLEKIKAYHPIVENVIKYRGLVKLKGTYVDGLLDCVKDDSKIHSEFQQKVTSTGRISSINPNMQNLPIRSEQGRSLRKGFVPQNDDYIFVTGDYSQIELRILAHLSDDKMLIDAYNNDIDIHTLTASQVFHCNVEEVTSRQRSNAKSVNFGIVYGISAFGLAEDIKVSNYEAAKYIDKYFETYSGVKTYLDEIVSSAEEKGYSTTILNRIRPIPELKSSNGLQRSFGKRIAMNTPIQGSAADIIKIAMVSVDKRLEREKMKSRLILQIHDELLIETYKDEKDIVAKILQEEMVKAITLKVPLEVHLSTGDNMYELK